MKVVAILDAGAQYGGLIDHAVWESGIRTVLLPINTPFDQLSQFSAIIITGGPRSVNEPGSPDCDPKLFKGQIPVLGICYGMQLMAKHCGGTIKTTTRRHDGVLEATVSTKSKLYDGLKAKQEVLLTHGDAVTKVPVGFTVTATADETIVGMENATQNLYATQFHPESQDTPQGAAMIKNFLNKVAGIKPYMSVKDLEKDAIDYIHDYVGDKHVMLFLSGGVDSTVLAALMAKAIKPARIKAFHIDTGFMRLHESDAVLAALQKAGITVTVIDAAKHFYDNRTHDEQGNELPGLGEAHEPEHKRKNIGDAFMTLREQIIAKHGLKADVILAQGSLRPDLIESASKLASVSGHADAIKTHHNDTKAVRLLRDQGRVCEPLQNFYKDQVRKLGRSLGLPAELVQRQPFPGPGLAIRILCHPGQAAATRKKLVDGVEILPIKTVGVQGDARSYSFIAGVTTDFAATADEWKRLQKLAQQLPQAVHTINRVVAITHRTPADAAAVPSVTPTVLSPGVVDLLRGADAIVNEVLHKHGLDTSLSQVPVILTPLAFSGKGHYSIALRPFLTQDFMTGRAALPGKDLPLELPALLAAKLFTYSPLIDAVMYDLSSKPPGTTEWE